MQIGETYEGGIVIYVDGTGENGLIVATVEVGAFEWAPTLTLVTSGATGELIGDGRANTDILLALYGTSSNHAAGACHNYGGGGWHLPSLQELQLVRAYDKIAETGNYFHRWTSTEASETTAYVVDFTPPEIDTTKTRVKARLPQDPYIVRAVKMIGSFEPFDISEIELPEKPTSSTDSFSEVTETTATIVASFTDTGTGTISNKGIVYNTSGNPFFGNGVSSTNSPNQNLGTESLQMSGLTPGLKYYIRSFAINEWGASYGNQIELTTEGEKIHFRVVTSPAESIARTSALLNGMGDLLASSAYTYERGFYVSKTNDFSEYDKVNNVTSLPAGAFEVNAEGLKASTNYFFKAYVISYDEEDPTHRTQFGETLTFTTGGIGSVDLSGYSKTSIDVINILYQHIKNSELFLDPTKPNGGLYKLQRPVNSIKEDVVIDGLPIDRDVVQEGLISVNIYVPNLKIKGDQSIPNTERLNELATLFNVSFDGETWEANGEYNFNIQQDNIFEDTNNQHYINFRIEFYSINV